MNNLLAHIWKHKVAFFTTFFLVFLLTYLVFVAIDFIPEPPSDTSTEESVEVSDSLAQVSASTTSLQESSDTAPAAEQAVLARTDRADDDAPGVEEESVLPTMINIESLGKSVPVLNPTSRTIADLDAALLEGVVRHPDSADLAQDGNIFILGHSSYLPNVMNRNYQAFNGIQNLAWGDTIEVYSDAAVFEYRVEKVYRARAQDVTVPIAGTGNKLTLATCNSFGSVDDRYIVEAKRVGTRAL